MEEIWKDIVGYEGLYQISTFGRLKSLNYKRTNSAKIIKGCKGKYITVKLAKNGKYKSFSIHRLVMLTFIKNTDNKRTVNHIDGDKHNNRIENLEWATDSENMKHLYHVLGCIPSNLGKKGKESKLSKKIEQRDLMGNLIKIWDSMADICREKGVSKSCICLACKGITKQAYGYKWIYFNK